MQQLRQMLDGLYKSPPGLINRLSSLILANVVQMRSLTFAYQLSSPVGSCGCDHELQTLTELKIAQRFLEINEAETVSADKHYVYLR